MNGHRTDKRRTPRLPARREGSRIRLSCGTPSTAAYESVFPARTRSARTVRPEQWNASDHGCLWPRSPGPQRAGLRAQLSPRPPLGRARGAVYL